MMDFNIKKLAVRAILLSIATLVFFWFAAFLTQDSGWGLLAIPLIVYLLVSIILDKKELPGVFFESILYTIGFVVAGLIAVFIFKDLFLPAGQSGDFSRVAIALLAIYVIIFLASFVPELVLPSLMKKEPTSDFENKNPKKSGKKKKVKPSSKKKSR